MGLQRRFGKITWLAAIAGAVVVAGAVHNELLGPRIRAVALANADPFNPRFQIFNPAFILTYKDVDMTCLPVSVTGRGPDGHAWHAKAQSFPLDVDIDLAPRASFEYTCPIASSAKTAPGHVEAKIAIRYTSFGRRKEAMSGTLSWDSSSRVWTGE